MKRKRVTELFPFLWPIRAWQKKLFFYTKLNFDKNKYSKSISNELLKHLVFEDKTKMINENSGFDIKYQENKVDNLKLTSTTLNKLIIKPGEVFSFWIAIKDSEKHGKFKDGLSLLNGKIIAEKGGGLCHISNFLFSMFLNTPLTVIERHSHAVKYFSPSDLDMLVGGDATVYEGWSDLKVKNNTDITFQIEIDFEDGDMIGRINSSEDVGIVYELFNKNEKLYKKNDSVYTSVDVYRNVYDKNTKELINEEYLHNDSSKVAYKLPDDALIEEL